jgi:hypothetical protein
MRHDHINPEEPSMSHDPMRDYYRSFNTFLDGLFDSMAKPRIQHICTDCGERPATETWDHSDAPIPMPPAAEHLCESCADTRRDRDAERKAEDAP